MKILLLATAYEIGGLSNVIRNIMDNLDTRKNEVVFLVERLDIRHYPLRKDIKIINMDIKSARGARKLVNIFSHIKRIRKTIVSESPDVVLSFAFPINCLYLLAFLWPVKKRPKIILGEYTELLYVKRKTHSFREYIFSFIYKTVMFLLYFRADAIVSVSESLSQQIRKLFLVDPKKIKVIHVPVNIIEVQRFSREEISEHNSNNLPCVGTVSRLCFEKGVNFLIEAFSDLIKKIDARLVIVGDGIERSSLERMTRELNIEDKVTFLGWVENPYKHLKSMDVFVLSSLYEGFPTAVIEAMLCSVPVVATKSVGGMQELIRDGMDGLLVPSEDTRALSNSIYRLLKDKDLRGRLAKEAIKKVGQFDSRNITSQYESLIASL